MLVERMQPIKIFLYKNYREITLVTLSCTDVTTIVVSDIWINMWTTTTSILNKRNQLPQVLGLFGYRGEYCVCLYYRFGNCDTRSDDSSTRHISWTVKFLRSVSIMRKPAPPVTVTLSLANLAAAFFKNAFSCSSCQLRHSGRRIFDSSFSMNSDSFGFGSAAWRFQIRIVASDGPFFLARLRTLAPDFSCASM